METYSLKSFAADRNIVSFKPDVKINVNGYPFITFIDADNKAINVWFSKGAATNVMAGQDFASIAKDYEIVIYDNDEGEERIKLSRKGGNRVAIETLFD
jgi:hypothetical protein